MRRDRRGLWLDRLALALVVGHAALILGAWGLLALLGERTRPTFFLLYAPLHPFAIAGVFGVAFALLRRRRALALVGAAATLVALFPLMGLRLGLPRAPGGPRLRLLSYNVFYAKLDREALLKEIVGAGADVVVLQASRTAFNEQLQAALPGWTVRAHDEFTLASRLTVREDEAPEDRLPGDALHGWARYALTGPSGPFEVIDVHPASARPALLDRADVGRDTQGRAAQLASAMKAAAKVTGPLIVVGDTNLPPLSAVARGHLAGLADAFAEVGTGFGYTFPAKLPWMRIDRAFGNAGVRWLGARVLPRGASDHRALVVDFEIAEGVR